MHHFLARFSGLFLAPGFSRWSRNSACCQQRALARLLGRASASSRAFTLIELLIVVAILAIFSSSLIAVVTAPAAEQKLSMLERDLTAGASLFFSHLIEEAHEAKSLECLNNALILDGTAPDGANIVYLTDKDRNLHRLIAATSETLVLRQGGQLDALRITAAPVIISGVRDLQAKPTAERPGMVRVRLQCDLPNAPKPVGLLREIDLAVGTFWTGGAQ